METKEIVFFVVALVAAFAIAYCIPYKSRFLTEDEEADMQVREIERHKRIQEKVQERLDRAARLKGKQEGN